MNQFSIDDLLPKQPRKKAIEVLKVFELFAGYGSQSLALKRFNIPFESVGYCEIDKYAIQAYKALHGDNVKNYGDITKVNVDELPDMNLLTYSFPCQDISVAGKQRGLSKDSGTRSSLLWECHRIIEAKRPEYLMMENVKNLVGKQNMPDFQAWLDTLTLLGYNNYWKVVNAKHCGVPQNRERVFCVSIRQDVDDGLFRFEEDFDNGIRLKHILETEVDEKYYISEEKTKSLISQMKGDEIGVTLKNQATEFVKSVDESLCLLARDYKGFGNQEMTAVVVPCITPDRLEKRQNGRRFKGDGDPMFTLTSQDRHGVLVKEATKQGYTIASGGDSINLEHPNSNTRRGRVGVGVAQTLTTSCNQAVVEPNEINQLFNIIETDSFGGNPQAGRIYGIDGIAPTLNTCGGGQREPKIFNQYRIRKLTPKECFRLMGLTDQEINLIQSTGISNSQQYKLAGNSIVVDAMRFLKNLNGGD